MPRWSPGCRRRRLCGWRAARPMRQRGGPRGSGSPPRPGASSIPGALPEVAGDAGQVVDADDPAALAAAMRRYLDDPALARDAAARGVARARHYSWDASAATLLARYRDLA